MCVLGEELSAKQHITNRAAGLPYEKLSVFGYIGLDYQGMDWSSAMQKSRSRGWASGRFLADLG